ncbi:uncharacterized protein DUF1566 [Stenotrophomonas rhizophila]|uniref:Uncharacterized protein DUF1566 n=1 Tax=Stenotrophomonas rhizophila TaxID=216778 RepID=A0A498CEP7_9GAMM|nr:DUF1566 domain-containing protein [Stenotrophomonas rhizophila]RLK56276.1 uncharacterized protein DUF1566 [Stenotrophomonas rhizophila]
MNTVTIRTEGTEITVSGGNVAVQRIQAGPQPVNVGAAVNSASHTKVFANGSQAENGSIDFNRTDHVAIIDHATGLMWAVKSIGDSDGDPMSQADCEKACGELRLLGHDDWRLPTRAELAGLVDDTRHEPSIDTNLFPGVLPRWHWTSTAAAWSSASAWVVGFSGGYVYSSHRDGSGFVLAVRRAGQ